MQPNRGQLARDTFGRRYQFFFFFIFYRHRPLLSLNRIRRERARRNNGDRVSDYLPFARQSRVIKHARMSYPPLQIFIFFFYLSLHFPASVIVGSARSPRLETGPYTGLLCEDSTTSTNALISNGESNSLVSRKREQRHGRVRCFPEGRISPNSLPIT